MPAGVEVTVPVPAPRRVTLTVWVRRVKVAVTLRAWLIASVHGAVPEHPAPDQPSKVAAAAGDGAADSVTDAPYA
jgi:hypothetical protein